MKTKRDYTDYHTFYGSKGRQGKFTFYVIALKLREVYETFQFYLDQAEQNPDYKVTRTASGKKRITKVRDASRKTDVQRLRNPKKVDEIIEYVRDFPDNWIFSALTASCDETIDFEPFEGTGERIGYVRYKKGTKLLLNDGQHRADAIGQIWRNKDISNIEDFGDQFISVVIFAGGDLRRKQQMFVDLQKGTQVNSALQHELSGAPEDELVRNVRDSIPFFRDYVVRDQTSISRGSCKIFTHKTFYDANRYVFGAKIRDSDLEVMRDFLTKYWESVVANIDAWEPFCHGPGVDTDEFRSEGVSHLSPTLHALGMIASWMYHQKRSLSRLERLKSVDWSKDNKELVRCHIGANGTRANNKDVRKAVRNYLWSNTLGYSLSRVEDT